MKTLYMACLLVAYLGYTLGWNYRCKNGGGTSGPCDTMIRGYLYSPWRNICFQMSLKGCRAVGKFFENKSDCLQCVK